MTPTNSDKDGLIEHERIYLEPRCCVDPYGGRQWCEDNVWPGEDCKASGIEYVRADLALSDRQAAVEAAVEKMRVQGQQEGKAAVCQWLRDRSATNPPATLWHAASILADQFEQSEIPASSIRGTPDRSNDHAG